MNINVFLYETTVCLKMFYIGIKYMMNETCNKNIRYMNERTYHSVCLHVSNLPSFQRVS